MATRESTRATGARSSGSNDSRDLRAALAQLDDAWTFLLVGTQSIEATAQHTDATVVIRHGLKLLACAYNALDKAVR